MDNSTPQRARYRNKTYKFAQSDRPPSKSIASIIGTRVNSLDVLGFAGWAQRKTNRTPMLRCRCQCGAEILVNGHSVRSGKSKSCGCLNVEAAVRLLTTHGLTAKGAYPPVYQAWRGTLNRCYRPRTKGYGNYGGRGITVCDRWRFGENGVSAFECFFQDMGHPPSSEHSIDRRDTNGNYEPANCHWILFETQSRNMRSNRWLTGFGKTQLMEDWGKEYRIAPAVLYNGIVKRGHSLEHVIQSVLKYRAARMSV